jgi:hypothetical protein
MPEENIEDEIILTKVKVSFDEVTGKIVGYFPTNINYNYEIPQPFIEILEQEQNFNDVMCVKNGIYQKYEETEAEQIKKLKFDLLLSRKNWLKSSDWYAARKIKRGIEIPEEIIEKDEIAAQQMQEIEDCTTLEQLEIYSMEF